DREPRAALPAVRDPLLGALSRADRNSPGPPGRSARPGRAEESVTTRRALLSVLAAAVAVWPWVAPRYFVFLASLIFVNVVVALGLNLLSGYTNQLSFGHAGFLAIGAYPAALVAIHVPRAPIALTLLAAGAVTAVVGLAFGVPCLRLGGLYLTMATL